MKLHELKDIIYNTIEQQEIDFCNSIGVDYKSNVYVISGKNERKIKQYLDVLNKEDNNNYYFCEITFPNKGGETKLFIGENEKQAVKLAYEFLLEYIK